MIEFKKIKDFENYIIHKDGYVKNLKTGRRLKPDIVSKGYEMIRLSKPTKSDRQYIHRLIAVYFIPNPFNKPFVNHKNGIKRDNRIENLEWCTPKENIKHAYSIGLVPHLLKVRQGAKLTFDQVRTIRNSKRGQFLELSEKFHVCKTTINNAYAGKTFKNI